jgi:hypothetical protein
MWKKKVSLPQKEREIKMCVFGGMFGFPPKKISSSLSILTLYSVLRKD